MPVILYAKIFANVLILYYVKSGIGHTKIEKMNIKDDKKYLQQRYLRERYLILIGICAVIVILTFYCSKGYFLSIIISFIFSFPFILVYTLIEIHVNKIFDEKKRGMRNIMLLGIVLLITGWLSWLIPLGNNIDEKWKITSLYYLMASVFAICIAKIVYYKIYPFLLKNIKNSNVQL